jgi:TPR repeat protein
MDSVQKFLIKGAHGAALGVWIATALGAFVLFPAHGSAQDSVQDGARDSLSASCPSADSGSSLEVLTGCAEKGNAAAQFWLGVRHGTGGGGVVEDHAEAVRWYWLAAQQGYAPAQSNLGWMYDKGDGVVEDDAEAVHWYELAADQGNAQAQYNLGWMYDNGAGVPVDDVEAVRLYRLAAEEGYADAQLNLGNMYANGQGVPQDDDVAYMWWEVSASQGSETARGHMSIIEQWMDGEQIAEAQRRSREWIEAHPQEVGN